MPAGCWLRYGARRSDDVEDVVKNQTQFVAICVCHWQASADYNSVAGTATKIFPSTATLDEVYQWYASLKPLAKGDLVISAPLEE